MAINQTVEAPNFEKIADEAGQFTSDAVNLLWAAINDTRASARRDTRVSQDMLQPKVLRLSPSASVNNLDLQGCSTVSFVGGSAQDFTGLRAPETGSSRLVFIQVIGAGTITLKNNATSDTVNRILTNTGADVALTTNLGAILVYLDDRWRQVT